MSRPTPLLRLTPRVAGALQEQYTCTDFNLDRKLLATVCRAELVMLAAEPRDLMPGNSAICVCLIGIEPIAEIIHPWSATEARLTFHQRLRHQLVIERRRKAA